MPDFQDPLKSGLMLFTVCCLLLPCSGFEAAGSVPRGTDILRSLLFSGCDASLLQGKEGLKTGQR